MFSSSSHHVRNLLPVFLSIALPRGIAGNTLTPPRSFLTGLVVPILLLATLTVSSILAILANLPFGVPALGDDAAMLGIDAFLPCLGPSKKLFLLESSSSTCDKSSKVSSVNALPFQSRGSEPISEAKVLLEPIQSGGGA